MKHTVPAVSQFIIWESQCYIIFFKCQLMFGRKGRHVLCETLRCLNLIFYFSSLRLCLCPPCQLGSNSLSSCQPPAGVNRICYKTLTSTHSGPNTVLLLAIDWAPTGNHQFHIMQRFLPMIITDIFHSTLDTHSWGFEAWILESGGNVDSKYDS